MTAHLTRNQMPPPSPRQREMIALTMEGVPNREIARRLFISEHTVKCSLGIAYLRLGLTGGPSARTKAAIWLWRETEMGRDR